MPAKPIPDGYPVVIPYLMIENVNRFVDFMKQVFDAELVEQLTRPDGKPGHTELRIGDSMIMLSEAMPPQYGATPVMLHFYVTDVDARFARALKAGATEVQKPTQQFYGDRSGGVKEPCGNTIWIATHVEDVPPDELKKRAAAAMQQQQQQ
jgi:uncharacterized glyoxalase superfamily protein PhnB